MGNFFAKLQHLFDSFEKDSRVLMLGLDAAGKTTVLNKLHFGEVVQTIPTIGFNVETMKYKNLSMTLWDVGGQEKIRPLWRHYFAGADALIFVVDSTDRERLGEAAEELHRVLAADELRHISILVLANKQDAPRALSVKDVAAGLQLAKERTRRWHIQASSATLGDGLYEGLDWLANSIRENRRHVRA